VLKWTGYRTVDTRKSFERNDGGEAKSAKRDLFCQRFPEWRISLVTPMMPFVYLLSGGVSLRSLMPAWTYRWIRRMEENIAGMERTCGMFAFIILERL
jgi:hypothetical protein